MPVPFMHCQKAEPKASLYREFLRYEVLLSILTDFLQGILLHNLAAAALVGPLGLIHNE